MGEGGGEGHVLGESRRGRKEKRGLGRTGGARGCKWERDGGVHWDEVHWDGGLGVHVGVAGASGSRGKRPIGTPLRN